MYLLEVRPRRYDFVDQVLNADHAERAQLSLNRRVLREGNARLVDFAVAALVHEVARRLQVGVPAPMARHDTHDTSPLAA